MANTLNSITTDIIFFGNKLLSILKPKLAFVGRIDTNQVQGSFFSAGDRITVPSLTVSGTMQKRAIDGGANVLSASSGSQTILLEQGTMSLPFDNLISTFTNVAIADELAERLAVKAANYIDSLVAGIYTDIPYAVGTLDGSALFNPTDGVNALNIALGTMSRNLAPTDRLRGLVGPTEAQNLRGLPIFQQAQLAGNADQRTTGRLGTYFGIELYESQNTPTNIALNTATHWGTPVVASGATPAIGDSTLSVSGLAATAAMKAGSIFTIGVDANGFAIPYTITANVTASGGAAILAIAPPLKTAPVAGNALVPRSHSAAGSQGLVYDPSVVQLVIRPQVDLLGPSAIIRTFKDPDGSSLEFRLIIESNVAANPAPGAAYQNTITMDILAGVGAPRPEFGVRLEGQT